MVPSFLPLLLSDIMGQQYERDKILRVSFKSTINGLNSGKETGRENTLAKICILIHFIIFSLFQHLRDVFFINKKLLK